MHLVPALPVCMVVPQPVPGEHKQSIIALPLLLQQLLCLQQPHVNHAQYLWVHMLTDVINWAKLPSNKQQMLVISLGCIQASTDMTPVKTFLLVHDTLPSCQPDNGARQQRVGQGSCSMAMQRRLTASQSPRRMRMSTARSGLSMRLYRASAWSNCPR